MKLTSKFGALVLLFTMFAVEQANFRAHVTWRTEQRISCHRFNCSVKLNGKLPRINACLHFPLRWNKILVLQNTTVWFLPHVRVFDEGKIYFSIYKMISRDLTMFMGFAAWKEFETDAAELVMVWVEQFLMIYSEIDRFERFGKIIIRISWIVRGPKALKSRKPKLVMPDVKTSKKLTLKLHHTSNTPKIFISRGIFHFSITEVIYFHIN